MPFPREWVPCPSGRRKYHATVQPRRATVDDARSLTALHLDVWDEAYAGLLPQHILDARRADTEVRVERWRSNLAERTTWVIDDPERPGRLLGFSTGGARRDDDPTLPERELWACYVRAEAYGRGLGYALLLAAIGTGPAYLWVLEGNARAIGFYERQGFVADGATTEAFESNELRMVRR